MTPSEWIFAAFVVLTVIHLFVPSARSGIVSIYDAGMFARADPGMGLNNRSGSWFWSEDVFLVQPGLNSRPGEQRPRYTGYAGVPGSQEHPAHRPLHRVVPGSIQGLLALIWT